MATSPKAPLRQHDVPLHLDSEGLAVLRERLRAANGDNHDFEAQYGRLNDVLHMALRRLEAAFGDQIERVMAVGDWAVEGIDLDVLPYADIVIQIVLRSEERSLSLYEQIAERVFADLGDEDVFIQFDLETLPDWRRAESLARLSGREEAPGIALLSRA